LKALCSQWELLPIPANKIIEWCAKPKQIRCDNGPKYISELLATRALQKEIGLVFVQANNPQQNAYVERYNLAVPYDWFSQYLFSSIEEVQDTPSDGMDLQQ
jgi:putative transposase